MTATAFIRAPWADPLGVLSGKADEPFALGLISGGGTGWSYVAFEPDAVLTASPGEAADPFAWLRERLGSPADPVPGAPPFAGGVAGLAAYGLARRIEAVDLGELGDWPDAAFGHYPAVLAFDHAAREVIACGRGAGPDEARQAALRAAAWLDLSWAAAPAGVLARDVEPDDPEAFEAKVAQVRERIAAGEIFQANIARRWHGKLSEAARPFDVFARLCAQSPAPHAAYLRLPGKAVVSNSPERFVSVDGGVVRSMPIKGTAPRSADLQTDRSLADGLAASPKDRAENLMIVDLMRNDLSRVCVAGSVAVPRLCVLETFANVHHLVSTVDGVLAPGADAADLLVSVFPPGSITGAPKVQAMKVISELEAPRGPFFGSMFWASPDGGFDSSVLIRTLAFESADGGWRFEARAGGGIVADSDPAAERRETEDKISAVLAALTEPAR